MNFSKNRFQQLAGITLKESTFHFAEHDHKTKIAERHAAEIIRELDIPDEDREVVFDELYNTLKNFIQNFTKKTGLEEGHESRDPSREDEEETLASLRSAGNINDDVIDDNGDVVKKGSDKPLSFTKSPHGKTIVVDDEPLIAGHRPPDWMRPDWEGMSDELEDQIDALHRKHYAEGKTMKITKSQLKEMIRESIAEQISAVEEGESKEQLYHEAIVLLRQVDDIFDVLSRKEPEYKTHKIASVRQALTMLINKIDKTRRLTASYME